MSDLVDRLWPAFQAESNEQLEAIELALVGDAAPDLNDLFRHFHTLKGGCGMMGFAGMEAIAHACEDLLDPVRKGERALDEGLVDALLAALDGLKVHLAGVERDRVDPVPAPELLQRLRALVAAPAAGKAAAPAAAAAPEHDVAPGIATLAAHLSRRLPALAEACLAPDPLPGAAREELLALCELALFNHADAIAELAERLLRAESAAARRHGLAELLERLAWAEKEHGVDAGVNDTAQRLRPAHDAGLRAASATLGALLHTLHAGQQRSAELFTSAEAQLDALLQQARLLCLRHTTPVLREALQALREWRRGGLVPSAELAELLHMAASLPGELLDGLEEDSPYQAMCEGLAHKLQEVVVACAERQGLQDRVGALARQHGIAPAALEPLDTAALDQLDAALARKDTLVEIEVDLEAASDSGQAFIYWLGRNGTLLGNRTVLADRAGMSAGTRLCFFAALPMAPARIQQALQDIEPAPADLRLQFCAGGESALSVAGATAPDARGAAQTATLRVESASVDAFVNRIGEMVTLRNMLAHALHRSEITRRTARVKALLREGDDAVPLCGEDKREVRELLALMESQREQLAQTDTRLQGTLSRLQEEVLALRVVPISLVFNRLPRVVRDLSHTLDRQVRLEVQGEEVRIDKGMVDVLIEPMLHLVRNALDHGIETPAARRAAGKPAQATLTVTARQQGNTLLVDVGDDGRGLDLDRIRARALANGLVSAAEAEQLGERELQQLVFLPGFSTADQVTEVSGRGVGMDAVRTRVQQLGGQVEVQSVAGQGATFTLRLPLSAAIQSVILVAAGDRQLAIPERNVEEIICLPATALQTVQGQACALLRGATLPLYHLAVLLGQRDAVPTPGATLEIVVMTDGVYRIGLLVEKVLGRPEVFLRDIHPDLARLPGVGGASVLGDGRVVIILDCDNLFELALRRAQSLRTLLRAS